MKVIKENPSANKNPNPNNQNINRNILEPIQLNLNNINNKKEKLIGKALSNTQEKNQKVGEDLDISQQNRHNLRPIEVKDYRKNIKNNNNANGTNSNFYSNQNSQNMNQNQNSNSNFYPNKNNNSQNKNHNYNNNNNNLRVIKPNVHKTVLNNHSHKNLFNNSKERNFDDESSETKNYNYIRNNINNNIFEGNNNSNGNDLDTNLKYYKELLKREKLQGNKINKNSKNLNSTTLDNMNSQSPDEEKRLNEKFSKTSNNFEFKILENLDIINLNTDISVLEENLKMNKGDLVKKLKSIYDNLNMSQNFKNTGNINKSIYQNTSMFDKNNNITRIETIFEDYEVKEEEMIHLNTTKSSRKLGDLRKMLHGGTCKIYVVRVFNF